MSDTLRRTPRWRWALIAAVSLPSAFVAVTMVKQQSKQHGSASAIAVVPEISEFADPDLIQLAVDRYSVRLQSDDVLLRVAARTRVPLATVRSGVSTASPRSANLRVVAAAPAAREARATADAMAEEGVHMAQRDPKADAELLATATDAAVPSTASPRLLLECWC